MEKVTEVKFGVEAAMALVV